METAAIQPPLPKLAWFAAAVALLNAAYLIFTALSGQIFVALPVKGEVVVPAGKYFVLGDNRDNSLDSRYFGFADAATVLGKPVFIYNSIDRPASETLTATPRGRVRWKRLFRSVR